MNLTETRIVAGSVVRMKSGGPPMTVRQLAIGENAITTEALAICEWFADDSLLQDAFPLAGLQLAGTIDWRPIAEFDGTDDTLALVFGR